MWVSFLQLNRALVKGCDGGDLRLGVFDYNLKHNSYRLGAWGTGK